MPFTNEEKLEIAQMMREVLMEDFDRRRLMHKEERKKEESAKVEALYLVTFAGHHIALPGEKGRAILSQCVYARVKVDPNNPAMFGGHTMEAIADGDGRRFKEPRNMILTGSQVCSMVEVSEALLTD